MLIRAAMHFGKLLRDGRAQARSLPLVAEIGVRSLEERLEDPGQRFRRHADAAVG